MATLTNAQKKMVHKHLQAKEKAGLITVPEELQIKPHRLEVIDAVDGALDPQAANVGAQNIATAIKQSIPTSSAHDGSNLRAALSNAQIGHILASVAEIRAREGVI